MKLGEQHKNLGLPSEEPKISSYTAIEIATLQAKLDQQLGPEFVSSRPGPGGRKLYYLQADKCISLANQVFGFNGWSSSVRSVEVDFLDEGKDGKWSVGVSVVVRVTLKDGTYHEDIGYGQMENGKKAQIFDKAKKEGATDALKRTLRSFGNVLGNCLHDKDYLAKVNRMKVPAPRFDERKLHRHSEFMPQVKKESLVDLGNLNNDPMISSPSEERQGSPEAEAYDEYGGDEFEELGIFGSGGDLDLMADDAALDFDDGGSIKDQSPINAITGGQKSATNYRNPIPQTNRQTIQTPQPQRAQQPMQRPQSNAPQVPRAPTPQSGFNVSPTPIRAQPQANNNTNFKNIQQGINQRGQPPQPPQQQQPQQHSPSVPTLAAPQLNGGPETPKNPSQNQPVGFFSGRAVIDADGENKLIPDQALAFNPHHQTSIPRSLGIDHSKSSPIARKGLTGPQGPAGGAYVRPNFENPSLNTNRQIGMPPQARGSGSFRQPGPSAGVKRPADVTDAGNDFRPTLGDAAGTNLNKQTTNFGNDVKRQARMS
ncbi:uncharacterized protein H6S33_000159 [Morchella sextelata]|uniref:uncharacterized protein n=1 Tax=Morchella sextelata TaxID=1174677 RepID=UPI001D03618B|nr:uncharacterized protein H6S33_000159 [Morchella sextelata]KAH0614523.1 hypothetical protein H6S33_000159 [Morchella sextelata]